MHRMYQINDSEPEFLTIVAALDHWGKRGHKGLPEYINWRDYNADGTVTGEGQTFLRAPFDSVTHWRSFPRNRAVV